jgi:hypothetical protein
VEETLSACVGPRRLRVLSRVARVPTQREFEKTGSLPGRHSSDRLGCTDGRFFARRICLVASGRLPFVTEGHQQLLCSDVFGIRAVYEPPPTALVAQELYPPLLESAAIAVFKGSKRRPARAQVPELQIFKGQKSCQRPHLHLHPVRCRWNWFSPARQKPLPELGC